MPDAKGDPMSYPVLDTRRSPNAVLEFLGPADVELLPGFWGDLRDRTIVTTLPTEYVQCETTGALRNFERAAGEVDAPFSGRYYSDSDVYKWVEAASWAVAGEHPPALRGQLERVIELIEAAQDDNGYLNSYFSVDLAGQRWSNVADKHEMYLLGHLTQAAVAHVRATGSTRLLAVAEKALTHVLETFPPGVTYGACGHPCLEMAAVELYRHTRDSRWLTLAQWQVDSRGRGILGGREYLLDHAPIRDQHFVTGHAVRALYLYAGVADLALEVEDPTLRAMCDEWWADITNHKLSITYGLGARWDGEAFGDAYELPDRAYNESCAAIGFIYFAQRMLALTGDGQYRDAIEGALYNAMLPGLSLDGQKFFYQNPLADSGRHQRQPWFECACCPPNIARMIVELPGLLAAKRGDALWINLLTNATIATEMGHEHLRLRVDTSLPYGGKAEITVQSAPAKPVSIHLPAPGWAASIRVTVNGRHVEVSRASGFLSTTRTWNPGDTLTVDYEAEPLLMEPHPAVAGGAGRAALTHGPLVYCFEDVDNGGCADLLAFTPCAAWAVGDEALPGVPTLVSEGVALQPDDPGLYRAWPRPVSAVRQELVAVPYFAWANRAPGTMRTLLPLSHEVSCDACG